jgi:hypothetical protein
MLSAVGATAENSSQPQLAGGALRLAESPNPGVRPPLSGIAFILPAGDRFGDAADARSAPVSAPVAAEADDRVRQGGFVRVA